MEHAFDCVLRIGTQDGSSIICYADDTLILASAHNAAFASLKASIQTGRVLLCIKSLGLNVSEAKTEATLLHGRHKPEIIPEVVVGNAGIQVKGSMKYLGIIVDSKWSFREHFDYVEAVKVARALCRLMPNFKDPDESKRQLYARTIMSVLLYGAPVWDDALSASKKIQQLLQRVQRTNGVLRRCYAIGENAAVIFHGCN